jgi:hypothetical protein
MADLLTLEEVRTRFAQTEPLAAVSFGTDPGYTVAERPVAIFGEKWMHGADEIEPTAPVPVWLEVPELGGRRFQLTFQAARHLGSTCRIPQDLQISIPADYHQGLVNWFLAEGLGIRRVKLLLAGTGEDEHGAPVPLAVAQTRDTVIPFSNTALLDEVLKVIAAKFGPQAAARAMVHFTMHHDLERTDFRVIVPEASRGVAGEDWAPGIEVTNSCIGLKQTTVTGLGCREAAAAVVLDTAHTAGGFKRLKTTPEQAYEWAGESAEDVVEALNVTWANVAQLAKMDVGDHAGTFVGSLCNEFRIPKNLVERVTAVLEEYPGALTMYGLATTMARLANMEGLSWRDVSQLMSMAGHIVHSVGARCSKDRPCYRALPQGFEAP